MRFTDDYNDAIAFIQRTRRNRGMPPVYNDARPNEKPRPNTNQPTESEEDSEGGSFATATDAASNHESNNSSEVDRSENNNQSEQSDLPANNSDLDSNFGDHNVSSSTTIENQQNTARSSASNQSDENESSDLFAPLTEFSFISERGETSIEGNQSGSDRDANESVHDECVTSSTSAASDLNQLNVENGGLVPYIDSDSETTFFDENDEAAIQNRQSDITLGASVISEPNQTNGENEANGQMQIKQEGLLLLDDIDGRALNNILSDSVEFLKFDDDVYVSSMDMPQPFSHLAFWVKSDDLLCGNVPFKPYVSLYLFFLYFFHAHVYLCIFFSKA